MGVSEERFAGLDLSYTDVFLPLAAYSPSLQSPVPWYEGTTSYLLAVARLAADTDDAQLSERATAGYLRRGLPGGASQRIDSTEVILAGSIIERRGPGSRAGPPDRDRAVSISTLTSGVSAMLLLIACANVATLLLVRANRRQREFAVRLALGVSRGRLAFQLLVEALLFSAVAGSVAVIVAIPGGRTLRGLVLPDVRWIEHPLDVRTLAFALALAAVVGLVAGLAPLLQSRRIDVSSSLKSGARLGTAGGSGLSSALIATQAALSIVLLVGAGLFLRSFTTAAALRLGFDVDGLAFVTGLQSEPGSVDHAQVVAQVSERLEATPGVLDVATASSLPMAGLGIPGGVRAREPAGPTGDRPPAGAAYNLVSSEFFEVAGIRILEGRGFEDGESSRVAVVDEALARMYWPNRTALGGCLVIGRPDGPCWEVVGVAEDQRSRVIEESTLQLFLPLAAGDPVRSAPPEGAILLRIDERHWRNIAGVAQAATYPRFSERTVRVGRMSDALEAQFRPWRVGAQLFGAFGMLALLITAVGVYGVMAYAVSRRTHEMGVRMALGARVRDVATLVLREGLRILVLGVVLGIAATLALGSLVESFLYGVTSRDAVSTAGAVVVVLAAGAAANLIPTWRATRVDPCEALRQD